VNTEETLSQMIENEGFYLYGTEVAKEDSRNIYRVLIKKENGHVSIDDCVKVTNIISPFLDVEEPMRGEYTLEVSSAGVERKLETKKHYKLSIGENMEIILFSGEKYIGVLKDFKEEKIFLEDKSAGEVEIAFSDIKKARTKLDF
jgi:ribosome maturation factor RimP